MPPGVSAAGFAERLRLSDPAVVARVENDSVLIDPRTVSSRDEAALVAVVGRALAP